MTVQCPSPWITVGLDEYLNDFINSSCDILCQQQTRTTTPITHDAGGVIDVFIYPK